MTGRAAERIIRAAIRGPDGRAYHVPPPGRHGHVFARFPQTHEAQPEDQGFLTDTGRFVGREEALKIAEAAGQIIKRSAGDNSRELYSEDVW